MAVTLLGQKESTGKVYPMQLDWEESYFVPFTSSGSKKINYPGLSLIQHDSTYSPNNYEVFQINLPDAKREAFLSPDKENIIISRRLDKYNLSLPRTYSFEKYNQIRAKKEFRQGLWQRAYQTRVEEKEKSGGKLEIGTDIAGQRVSLQIGGNINIQGKIESQQQEGSGTVRNANSTSFLVEQQQQLNAEGTIGDRISLNIDWDSERDFDFQNRLKVHYKGKEDEIVQSMDAGNINLSLPGAQLITFSPDKSGLMGIKSKMKFGGTNVTTVAGLEKGENSQISLQGGETSQTQEIEDYNFVRNQYFYLDTLFRKSMWEGYWEKGDKFQFVRTGRRVEDYEVYKSTTQKEDADAFQAIAFTHPNHTQSSDSTTSPFKRLKESDYTIYPDLGFIRLRSRIRENEILGVVYKAGETEYGDYKALSEARTPRTLKMIKPRSMGPKDHSWKLMWKNIYSLGTRGISPDNINIKVINTASSSGQAESNSEGTTFLQMLGLDELKSNNSKGHDGQFDKTRNAILDTTYGEIWLPFVRPFQHGDGTSGYINNPKLDKKYSKPSFYTTKKQNNTDQLSSNSQFKIEYKTSGRSSVLDLGPMVKEGSVTVTLNGTELTKGTDYRINYISGKLTLLKDAATNPNADLQVKYEKNQMFQLSKKTILGTRIEREFEKDNEASNIFLGGTALYYSKSVQEDKVDVGYEPYSNTVLGINGKYEKKLPSVTALMNKIPLIELNQPTKINAEAEIAQVNPNPNTINNPKTGDNNGVAFIDDFEGSKRTTPIPITRRNWIFSSVPVGKQDSMRGKIRYYNPYDKTETKKIWPEKDISNRKGNNTTNTLNLQMDPEWARAVGNFPEVTNQEKKKAWAGIFHYFDAGQNDFSRSKYIEIWVKGDKGQLHVDLGAISEDINNNGEFDTEDKNMNGIIDKGEGEDLGLDGVRSQNEEVKVYYPDGTSEILGYGDQDLNHFKRNPEDPHSDDYHYNTGSDDYSKINGTEGNSTGNDMDQQMGRYPNTEDRNGTNSLETENDYVSASIQLDGKKYLENQTVNDNGQPTGWKLYKIPLREFKRISELQGKQDFNFSDVKAVRLWMDSVASKTNLEIAKMEIVGNDWQEKGLKRISNRDSSYTPAKKTFGVSVLNNQENSTIYTPPEGVKGEYDKVNKVRKKEQSLTLDFFKEGIGLRPGQKCAVEKDLLEEMSLLNYKKLKFFVHGPANLSNDSLLYYLKFGRIVNTNEHMYEIRAPLESGWKEVVTELNFISSLKKYNHEKDFDPKKMGGTLEIQRDSSGNIVRRIFREKQNGKYTGKQLIINGKPAITRIKTLQMGLINKGDFTFNESVWIDELRVSDVNKESGVAMRSQIDVTLGDLGGFNVRYNRKDGNYHRAEKKTKASPNGIINNNNLNLNGNLNLDQLIPIPTDWGISVPISGSYRKSQGIPDFYPGSDISVKQGAAPDSIKNLSRSSSFTTSLKKTKESDFWLTKYTIDQLRLNYNAKWSNNSSLNNKFDKSKNYSGKVNYSIPFDNDNKIKIFQWAESIPLIGKKLSGVKWHYTPSSFRVQARAAESQSRTQPRRADTIRSTYNFGMNSSINFDYQMFDALNFSYNRDMKNNLRDYRYDKQAILQNLDFGVNTQVNESYQINYSPKLFEWLQPNFTAKSNYNWSEPYNSTSSYLDELTNKRNINGSFSLDLANLWKQMFLSSGEEEESSRGRGRSSRSRSTRRRNRQGNESDNQDANQNKEDGNLLESIHSKLKGLQTINVNISQGRSINNRYRIKGKPTLKYRLGLDNNPQLRVDSSGAGAVNLDLINRSKNISISSGFKITNNINTSFSFNRQSSKSINKNKTQQTINGSYLPIKFNQKGLSFPNWRFSWNNFQELPFINNVKFIKSISLKHSFSGQRRRGIENGSNQTESFTRNFQPLIGTSLNFQNSLSGSFRMNKKTTFSSDLTTGKNRKKISNSFSGNISYTKKDGFNFSIPFIEGKLKNDITFQMNFSYNKNITKVQQKIGEEFTPKSESTNWSLSPRANYKISNNVNGSLFLKYNVNNNIRTPKRTNINGGITVNIAIKG